MWILYGKRAHNSFSDSFRYRVRFLQTFPESKVLDLYPICYHFVLDSYSFV